MLNWPTWTSLPFWSCFWEASHAWLTFMKCITRHSCVCPVYVLHHLTKFCVPLSTSYLYTDLLMCHHPCSITFSKFLTRLFASFLLCPWGEAVQSIYWCACATEGSTFLACSSSRAFEEPVVPEAAKHPLQKCFLRQSCKVLKVICVMLSMLKSFLSQFNVHRWLNKPCVGWFPWTM